MYLRSSTVRKFNRKLKLCRYVHEEYANDIEFKIPRLYDNGNVVYVLSEEIVAKYSTVILYEGFNWIVCESHIVSAGEKLSKYYSKFEENYLLFRDKAVRETAGKGVEEVKKYFKRINAGMIIDIFDCAKMRVMCENGAMRKDILYSEMVEGVGCEGAIAERIKKAITDENTGYKRYIENVEYGGYGTFITGMLCVSHLDSSSGEVVGTEGRTSVKGLNMNRAMHGDEVDVVEGRVVAICNRKIRQIVGTLYKKEDVSEDVSVGYVWPIDRRLPELRVLVCDAKEVVGNKVVIRVVRWDENQKYPVGLICKVLGKSGVLEIEINAVMEEYGVRYGDMEWLETLDRRRIGDEGMQKMKREECQRKKGIDEAGDIDTEWDKVRLSENLGNDMTAEGLRFNPEDFCVERAFEEIARGKRIDLRDIPVFSIDPPRCVDIDDAMHCILHDGWIEVGVHIADVSFFVKEGSVLDREAQHRSTTLYLPGRRIDMLPPFISADLCSLHEKKDRASVSCLWKFSYDFKVLETKIFRSLVRSRRAFSYDEVNELLNTSAGTKSNHVPHAGVFSDRNSANEIARLLESIGTLMKIATKLRADRFDNGALQLNAESNCEGSESSTSHNLIEEFMLLANISIAKFIHANSPICAILRRHPFPATLELDLVDCSSSKTINKSLAQLKPEMADIFRRIISRSMYQAIYFINSDSADFYHYGLAIPIYTHFTSPIRRYADILVHRILLLCLDKNKAAIDSLPESITTRSVSYINYRHRGAQNISRAVYAIYTYLSIAQDVFEGVVVAVKEGGYFVYIKDLSLEEFIVSTKKYKVFDKLRLKLIKNVEQYFITRRVHLKIL